MTFTSDEHIASTARRFIDCTLPKPDWTHAAHFAVALFLLKQDGAVAFETMPPLIRAYNEATGVENSDTDGYHETITRASLLAADHVSRSYPAKTALHTILTDLLHGKYGRSAWLLEHWRRETLFSVEARMAWIAPDLKPLGFAPQRKGDPTA